VLRAIREGRALDMHVAEPTGADAAHDRAANPTRKKERAGPSIPPMFMLCSPVDVGLATATVHAAGVCKQQSSFHRARRVAGGTHCCVETNSDRGRALRGRINSEQSRRRAAAASASCKEREKFRTGVTTRPAAAHGRHAPSPASSAPAEFDKTRDSTNSGALASRANPCAAATNA
jgi:hypothetical protein